ncbi:MAG TPA: HAD-IA family hydrolase [Thermoleophilaceae bacterium]|nr:HAD-IA family hydrolase [Thermoleophilaceae bacterium]
MSGAAGAGGGGAPRAVLLDALGTLVALEPPAPRLRAELARRGYAVSAAAAEAAVRAEIAYYLEHHLEGRDERSLADLRDRCAAIVRRSVDVPGLDGATARAALLASLSFRAQPDAAPALRELRARGLRLVVASNWDCSLPEVLAEAGLAALVDGAVSSGAVGAAKPDPRVFEAALAFAGVGPGEAVHVGDSVTNDVAGARAAGVRPILLLRQGEELRPAGTPSPSAAAASARSGGAVAAGDPGAPVIRTLAELPSLVLERG